MCGQQVCTYFQKHPNKLEWLRLLCLFLWVHLPLCPPPPFWRSFSSASFHQLGSGTFRPSSSSLFCGSCWQKQPLTSSSNYSHWCKCLSKNGQASFKTRCKAITHARPMVLDFFLTNVIWRKIGQLCQDGPVWWVRVGGGYWNSLEPLRPPYTGLLSLEGIEMRTELEGMFFALFLLYLHYHHQPLLSHTLFRVNFC